MSHTAISRRIRRLEPRLSSKIPASATLETIVLALIAVLLLAGAMSSATPVPQKLALVSLKVQQGDTLWTLAGQHPVQGMSTAEVADLIAKENRRDRALLKPGEQILVPAVPIEDRLASR